MAKKDRDKTLDSYNVVLIKVCVYDSRGIILIHYPSYERITISYIYYIILYIYIYIHIYYSIFF